MFTEADLSTQLEKYCNSDAIFTDTGTNNALKHARIYHNNVLVIDTEGVYLYFDDTHELKQVCRLESVHEIQDITQVRNEIITMLID